MAMVERDHWYTGDLLLRECDLLICGGDQHHMGGGGSISWEG